MILLMEKTNINASKKASIAIDLGWGNGAFHAVTISDVQCNAARPTVSPSVVPLAHMLTTLEAGVRQL